jgi:long-chain acyl-CoA synthetase
MNNLAEVLLKSAPNYTSKPLIVFGDGQKSYDLFCDDVKRLATALGKRGARPGARVVLLAQNSPEWLASFFAIVWTGAAAVPINPGLTATEVRAIVDDCEPAVAIVDEALAYLSADLPSSVSRLILSASKHNGWHRVVKGSEPSLAPATVASDDPSVIFYTSGTTGKPKGVMLTHAGMIFDVGMFAKHLQISPQDRSLVVGSMAFMLHLILNATSSVLGGSTIYLLDRFRPESTFRAIAENRITLLMAVPTVYIMMLNWLEENGQVVDVSSIRWAISAGASFPGPLYQRARSQLNMVVYDLWGLSECAPVTSYYPGVDHEGRPDSCGRPLPDCAIRIVDDGLRDLPAGDVGEVLLRSPAMMSGYFKNPIATAETIFDGWVRSGDLGKVDADGFLYIVGRRKDMIIRGGSNIYPVEIEEVLYAHSAVAECAVIGVPDATFGEAVKACIALKEGYVVSADELRLFCRQRLAEYKCPSQFEFLPGLPKGPTGKILRRELRDMHQRNVLQCPEPLARAL